MLAYQLLTKSTKPSHSANEKSRREILLLFLIDQLLYIAKGLIYTYRKQKSICNVASAIRNT